MHALSGRVPCAPPAAHRCGGRPHTSLRKPASSARRARSVAPRAAAGDFVAGSAAAKPEHAADYTWTAPAVREASPPKIAARPRAGDGRCGPPAACRGVPPAPASPATRAAPRRELRLRPAAPGCRAPSAARGRLTNTSAGAGVRLQGAREEPRRVRHAVQALHRRPGWLLERHCARVSLARARVAPLAAQGSHSGAADGLCRAPRATQHPRYA